MNNNGNLTLKDWLLLAGVVTGIVGLGLLAMFFLRGGSLQLDRVFGNAEQKTRYDIRQASPEVIEGKKQVIDQAQRDLCDPTKVGFKVAAERQILDAARELDDLSVLPKDQQTLVAQIKASSYKCPAPAGTPATTEAK
jgi:hypothetical protein